MPHLTTIKQYLSAKAHKSIQKKKHSKTEREEKKSPVYVTSLSIRVSWLV